MHLRLLHALYREAMYIVDQGIADPGTRWIGAQVRAGSRFQVMADLSGTWTWWGLDLGIAVVDLPWPHLADTHEVFPMMTERVAKGELGLRPMEAASALAPEEQKAFRERLLDHLARQAAAGALGQPKRLSEDS